MKNRLSALAAGTAICALVAAPATAGYTIYEDTEMPSVLFIEFDEPDGGEPTVISAPGGFSAPALITDDRDGPDQGGGSAFADDDQGDDEEPSFEDRIDETVEIDSDYVRDLMIEDAVREELFNDTELR